MNAAPLLPEWLRLRCPECGADLTCAADSCRCERGHSFVVHAGVPHLVPAELSAPDAGYVRWISDYYRVPFSARQRRLADALFRRFLDVTAPLLPVLDVGAGRADKSSTFPSGQYVGVDPIDPIAAGMVQDLPAPLIVARGERLPFAAGQFGSIMLWAVLDHVADRAALFAECARVLRPGGRLCLMTQVMSERDAGLAGLLRWIISRIRTGDVRGMLAVARFTYADPRVRTRLSPLTVESVRQEVASHFGEPHVELVDGHSLILRATR